ncbi:BatD family protein [Brumimicrobium aurantiacum]|uniref:Protein BatD n=1 Tax=Brumimicrobium aurantiacum TaxID=1737063 RepID=A0A3E1EY10_9FLAO|nr:BatD family protein [Brumimicrobium aurantiacum]RFC54428.1 hypothetical protein DXU93_08370 [Brumimicrobium aurantiacum]
MVRAVLLNIIFGLLVGFTFGQDAFVQLDVDPKTAESGQAITVTIKTNIDGKMNMNLPDEFIQTGAVQTGMSSSIVYVDGRQKAMRYNYQTFTGYFEKEGDFELGPVIVKSQGESVQSKVHKVKVISRQNMLSADPSENMDQMIFGIIEQSKNEIYEGEPLLLEAKVYAQVNVLQFEAFNTFSLNGSADVHALANPNRVSSAYAVINGKNIQTFKMGKSVIFPEKIGDFDIEPFQSIIFFENPRTGYPKRAKISSNQSTIKVKPLPTGTPKHFIGAVGEFDVTSKLSNTKLDQGKVVELDVTISGHGNLHNIKKPIIYLPNGLSFYGDPEVVDSINFSSRGAEGTKKYTFFIQVNRPGKIQINPIKIAYFNPETEKYESATSTVRTLNVKSNGQEIVEVTKPEKEEVQLPMMQPYITEQIGVDDTSIDLFRGWKGTALIFSPLMLGFIFGIGVRIKNNKSERSTSKRLLFQHREEALGRLSQLHTEDSNLDKLGELTKILISFLASEFNVSKGEISRAFVNAQVGVRLTQEANDQLIDVFDELDAMKYGGSIENSDISELKMSVEEIIKSFE